MSRRGAALLVALLALMLAAAIASAALAAGHLRWRAGLARRAAAVASLEVSSALEQYSASWSTAFDSIPVGRAQEIARADLPRLMRRDSLMRLSVSLFQLKSVVAIGPPGAAPLGREGAVLLVRRSALESPARADDSAPLLQTGVGLVDGIGWGGPGDSLDPAPRRVPGGWWRVD